MTNVVNQYGCQACGVSFPNQQELMEHAEVAHRPAQAPQHEHFGCQACGE